MNFLKLFETHFDALLKVHKNTGEKIFAKYHSANACFVKTNNINCDDNDVYVYVCVLYLDLT